MVFLWFAKTRPCCQARTYQCWACVGIRRATTPSVTLSASYGVFPGRVIGVDMIEFIRLCAGLEIVRPC